MTTDPMIEAVVRASHNYRKGYPMDPTIYLHPKPTDQPEAHFRGEVTVDLQLAQSIAIIGRVDDDTAEYMDRLSSAAARLAQAIRDRRAAWQSRMTI